MRIGFSCVTAWLALQTAACAITIGNSSPDGDFFGYRGSFRLAPVTGPVPFEMVFDVNGEEKRINKDAMIRILADTETGESSFNWFERGVRELIGFSGGGRYKIISYPVKRLYSRHALQSTPSGQIYTQVFRWVGDGVGENFGFQPYVNALRGHGGDDTDDASMEWTQPLIIQAIEQVDEDHWMLRGVTGPRWTGDVTLFDRVVAGESFTVRLKEFGFGDLGDVLAATSMVPEPTGWALVTAGIVPLIAFRLRFRQYGRGNSA